MSQNQGQISRLAMCIQYKTLLPAFPGWVGDAMGSRLGSASGWGSALLTDGGASPPNWMSNVQGGQRVYSREFLHYTTRYPERTYEIWRYACEISMVSSVTTALLTVWAAELYRASHDNHGTGGKGTVTIEAVTVYYGDGTQEDKYVNTVLFNNIDSEGADDPNYSATIPDIWKWEGSVAAPKPIAKVRMSLIVYFGHGEYHDTGDRSPAYWTPTGVVGHTVAHCGYDFAIPPQTADRGNDPEGLIDRENTYIASATPGAPVVIVPPESSVARTGLKEKIGTTCSPPCCCGDGGCTDGGCGSFAELWGPVAFNFDAPWIAEDATSHNMNNQLTTDPVNDLKLTDDEWKTDWE